MVSTCRDRNYLEMTTVAKLGKRDRPPQRWFLKLLENIRSQMTWLDLLVGLCASAIIAVLLIGFRYQFIPDYKTGEIANEDVRALQDLTYVDANATDERRLKARENVPALYQLDSNLVFDIEGEISKAFLEARDILAEKQITSKEKLTADIEKALLKELEAKVGDTFPPNVLSILLHQYFNPVLEGKILKILDRVLRDGILRDRAKFLEDQSTGIIIRDSSIPFERPLADAYLARDLPAAKEYLRQFHLDFSELSQKNRSALIEYLESKLVPTLIYNEKETEDRRTQAASRVLPVEVQIRQGRTIVYNGEKVTASMISQLEALRNLQKSRSLHWQFIGCLFFVVVLVYSLWRYLVFHQSRHRKIKNHTGLILVIIACELLVMRLMTALANILSERFDRFHDPFVLYLAIPFAFGAVLVTLLVDVNLGIISSVILATLVGLFFNDVTLAVYLLVGSLAGIFSIRQYNDRAAILKAGLTIGAVNIFCLAGITILRQTPVKLSGALDQILVALLSGILASALASMMLPALESIFKITTDIRLLELSNLNAPILRRLSVEAPATYHHSLMVATLSEAAAEVIGANPLLVRVAAYYHDLGKLSKPEYFVENQIYGINKHESLPPSKSCEILSSHVKDGLEIANEIGLPQRISDMIPQHHGTRVMTYFYQKAKESVGATRNHKLEEADFRYPGPKPRSKEAAIMMMADSVEAASRTLSNPTTAQIKGMIDRIVETMVSDKQFDECDITLREIQCVEESFFKILTGLYHRRIDYPGYDFKGIGNESETNIIQNSGSKQAEAI